MDYKKLYKDTITKLQEMVNSGKITIETACGICADFIPESEDERIRKALTEMVHDTTGDSLWVDYDVHKEDALAWLEKQVPVDEDKVVKGVRRGVAISLINYIDANSKGMCLSNMECEDIESAIIKEDWDKVYAYIKKKLEKQGEQKASYTTIVETGDGGINALVTRELPTDGCDDEQIPAEVRTTGYWNVEDTWQKPAWSEEDRQTLRLIIDDLSEELNDEPDKADKEILCRKISFLKSLKPHPIHVWSREDNRTRLEITNYLECQKREEPTRTDILNKWIAWIANLDPQGKQGPQWRPSELQLECLDDAIKHYQSKGYRPVILMELLEDLKKLKD